MKTHKNEFANTVSNSDIEKAKTILIENTRELSRLYRNILAKEGKRDEAIRTLGMCLDDIHRAFIVLIDDVGINERKYFDGCYNVALILQEKNKTRSKAK